MMKKIFIPTNNKGFTILELLIATTIFAVILLICTVGIIEVGKNYYKGSTIIKTQNVARTVMDEITQALQFGSSIDNTININNTSGNICLGNKRFIYTPRQRVTTTTHALEVEKGCSGSPTRLELLGNNMQLFTFNINGTDPNYTVTIKVVYADQDDLIDTMTGDCLPGAGSQFCASSYLSTTVTRRVN